MDRARHSGAKEAFDHGPWAAPDARRSGPATCGRGERAVASGLVVKEPVGVVGAIIPLERADGG